MMQLISKKNTFIQIETVSRFPMYAADILSSNVKIMKALSEGGWSTKVSKSNTENESDKLEQKML